MPGLTLGQLSCVTGVPPPPGQTPHLSLSSVHITPSTEWVRDTRTKNPLEARLRRYVKQTTHKRQVCDAFRRPGLQPQWISMSIIFPKDSGIFMQINYNYYSRCSLVNLNRAAFVKSLFVFRSEAVQKTSSATVPNALTTPELIKNK